VASVGITLGAMMLGGVGSGQSPTAPVPGRGLTPPPEIFPMRKVRLTALYLPGPATYNTEVRDTTPSNAT
jgi:hypothetical protein